MDHLHLKPTRTVGDTSDLYNLGYVQNVIAGQLLAQIVPLETVDMPDPRFIQDTPELSAGPNTRVDPEHPTYLLASANGYVFYYDGHITVKKMLNVRSDVSFQTGNIFFVGDVAVHGSVRAGFEVQANNVLVKNMVEGGVIRARRDLAVVGGTRGGAGEHCLLDAGETLRSAFVEKAEIRARGNIMVEKYCLYSKVFAGSSFVLRGKMYGGTANIYGSAYIQEQLGNSAAISTRIYLGYDPLRIRQLERGDAQIAALSENITHLTAIAGHLPPDTNDATRRLAAAREKRDHLIRHRDELWQSLHLDEQYVSRCRLIVPGAVYPGVEVAIGRSFFSVDTEYHNVIFSLRDDEVVVESAAN